MHYLKPILVRVDPKTFKVGSYLTVLFFFNQKFFLPIIYKNFYFYNRNMKFSNNLSPIIILDIIKINRLFKLVLSSFVKKTKVKTGC